MYKSYVNHVQEFGECCIKPMMISDKILYTIIVPINFLNLGY